MTYLIPPHIINYWRESGKSEEEIKRINADFARDLRQRTKPNYIQRKEDNQRRKVEVIKLFDMGMSRKNIAIAENLHINSVYRILRNNK